jgi:shikimate dehydrogenase
VINATSIGLYDADARLALDVNTLQPGWWSPTSSGNSASHALDPRRRGTRLRPLDGLGMLVNQGIVGVQYWTGIEPDATVMRKALENALGL